MNGSALGSRLRDSLVSQSTVDENLRGFDSPPPPLDVKLEEPLGSVDVLETVGSELADADVTGLVLHELAGRIRKKNLAAVCDRANPGSSVDAEPDVALVA
jgi:hypothetical protein